VSTVLRAYPPPRAARPIPHGRPVEGHAPSLLGVSRVALISLYRHAVVITPVARWVGSLVKPRIPAVYMLASGCGLPHLSARSASTLVVSRPARRSLALRPACSLHRQTRHIVLEGSDGFVTSTAAPIATGWSDRLARWELHPLKTNTFTFAISFVSASSSRLDPR